MVLLAAPSTAMAANREWSTRVWQTDDGLLDNYVNSIVQGPDNYLWLVTPIGLVQFDGENFFPFPIEDFTGPAASHVRVMLRGRTGVLWMASDGGTVIGLKPDFSMVSLPEKLPVHVPTDLAEDLEGGLWLGYSDAVYRVNEGHLTKLDAGEGLPPGPLHSLLTDGAGNIWLAKGDQICLFKNGTFFKIAGATGLRKMAAGHANTVWFDEGSHLYSCDNGGHVQDHGAFQNSAAATEALLEDRAGGVWIGTDGNGLIYYHNSTFERIETSHSAILGLAEDREGNIWAGTGGAGLDRISLSGVRLEAMENNQVLSQIQSICQDSQGTLWGATRNGNLASRTGEGWKTVFTNAPFAGKVSCVASDRAAIWIGARNGKLFRLVNTNCLLWENNAAEGGVRGLLATADGDVWIAGEKALQCVRGRQLWTVSLPPRVQRIYAIGQDASGTVWLGANGILVQVDGQNFTTKMFYLQMSDRPICCLDGTADGSLWIGSRGGGLIRFKDGHFSRIGVEQGLFDNYISQMIADGHGWMWFGANHGIFKVRLTELEHAMDDRSVMLRPVIYGKNEGLASQEAVFSTAPPNVLPNGILGNDGTVWMLMHAGVVVANPSILPQDPAPPPALLTRLVMDDQTLASYGGVAATQQVVNLQKLNVPLHLPPSYRHLEFDFTAVHLSDPENVHIRYQLSGFDTHWIDSEGVRSASYSRLTAGNYEFHVEACIGDGPWSQAPATLALIVDPFFWQTWWFQFGAVLLFTLSVIALVRYISFRRLRWKLQLAEQQAAVERERGRIARDIHDDLGNRLTKIQLLTGLAQKDRTTLEKAIAHVRQIALTTRQATDALDEIVWAINPRNDTLPHLINYLGQFAVDFLRTAGIRCRVDLPPHPAARPVAAEVRHNLFLVIKESLNNIVHHANATEVFLSIHAGGESLSVVVQDNGRGFNGEVKNNEADGLENMRRRIAEIGGHLQIESEPGKGTRISFDGQWLERN